MLQNESILMYISIWFVQKSYKIAEHVIKRKASRGNIFETTSFNTRKIWNEVGNNPVPTGRFTKEYAVTDSSRLSSMDIIVLLRMMMTLSLRPVRQILSRIRQIPVQMETVLVT